jgi:midasin
MLTCSRRRVVDIHGILLLRDPSSITSRSTLVSTPSTVKTLRALAVRLSLRLPILLSSSPSAGKSVLLEHLASLIYPSFRLQLVTLHLSDTSIDARSLLGSYVSSTKKPGSFEWQEGVVVRAMRHGLWLVLEDIDRASLEVLGTLIPLIESLAVHKHIGAPASLEIPGHGRVEASEGFALFATRSVPTHGDKHIRPATFLGSNKFTCVDVPTPTEDELVVIVKGKFSRLGQRRARAIIKAWADVVALGAVPGVRETGIHELETWCRRVESLLPPDPDVDMEIDELVSLENLFPHISIREEIYLEARDVFFGSGAFSDSAQAHMSAVSRTFARHLGLSDDRARWVLESRLPELQTECDDDGHTAAMKIGKTRLPAARRDVDLRGTPQRPFAMHRPALLITERISASISLAEPVLLVGETGTGKTTLVSHIATLLHRRLISLNLSHQTEGSDLLGGFKPVDARVPASDLQRQFLDLFARTFSRRKNSQFEDAVRKAVSENRWKRAVGLWKECARLALDKIKERATEWPSLSPKDQNDPRCVRKSVFGLKSLALCDHQGRSGLQ